MSAPALEGGQDYDDIMGFPGDGFVDKTDANPGVLVEQDEEDVSLRGQQRLQPTRPGLHHSG
jgi:hypothetical protein